MNRKLWDGGEKGFPGLYWDRGWGVLFFMAFKRFRWHEIDQRMCRMAGSQSEGALNVMACNIYVSLSRTRPLLHMF